MSDAVLVLTCRVRDGHLVSVCCEEHHEVAAGSMCTDRRRVASKVRYVLSDLISALRRLRRRSGTP